MAGVPSVLVSNFSFDTILDALDGPDPEVVAAFRNLYAHVSLLLKLPGNVGMDRWERSGSTPVEPMPLVARTCRRSRDDVRRELHLPLDAKCLLITFGGFQMATDKVGIDAATALPDGWLGIVVSAQDLECTPPDRFRIVPPNSLFMPDVINASDVVLGKLGYGTCSEAVAHGVPMLYVVRPHFIEESGLLDRLMRPHGVCLELARADFDAGRWASSVLAVRDLARSQPPLPIALDGAERVAQRLVALAQDTLAPA
ncbi:hypothetical protein HK105_205385 [Polyrhizophydium stewartii]|uniref:Glycosyl transferase family 28 C-terminal domain-containing protein n=1 Tax=Polyrhizophydium stewartii TaxID=2732419 RepID=A0ABR4N6B6_9FUNG